MNKLLALRAALKTRKPHFARQDSHKKKRVTKAWRRPRGVHSKQRHNKWSYPKRISIGYKSPVEVRGLHPSGLKPVLVHNVLGLKGIDAKTQGIIIASSVGTRKRADIIKNAGAIHILNLKNTTQYLTEVAKSLAERKKAVADRKAKASAKATAKIKTAKEAKSAAKPTKEQEKAEKDKIITHKS
ncbi:50S ribosomal protein L32e [Candidatus Woesearchaeota archaeon]|nr:50S ribosomal protein L32e [Candidatus Woesearchaeota archaeon]